MDRDSFFVTIQTAINSHVTHGNSKKKNLKIELNSTSSLEINNLKYSIIFTLYFYNLQFLNYKIF